jgi:hypothetical protein
MTIVGRSRKTISAREYYCYKLQMRPDEFNILFYGGRFFQQWLMDMYVKVESMRLDWYSLSKHQKIIWAELYSGIVDTLQAGEAHASEVGRRVVLPRNFNGGERDVQARFFDAITLVQQFGKPDSFHDDVQPILGRGRQRALSKVDTARPSRVGCKGL